MVVGHKMQPIGSGDPLALLLPDMATHKIGDELTKPFRSSFLASSSYPDYPVALYYVLGIAYYERQAWPEAIQALEVALSQMGALPDENVVEHALDIIQADILGPIGIAYLELKQCETGAALVKRAVDESRRRSDWDWALDRIEACYISITPTPTPTGTPAP